MVRMQAKTHVVVIVVVASFVFAACWAVRRERAVAMTPLELEMAAIVGLQGPPGGLGPGGNICIQFEESELLYHNCVSPYVTSGKDNDCDQLGCLTPSDLYGESHCISGTKWKDTDPQPRWNTISGTGPDKFESTEKPCWYTIQCSAEYTQLNLLKNCYAGSTTAPHDFPPQDNEPIEFIGIAGACQLPVPEESVTGCMPCAATSVLYDGDSATRTKKANVGLCNP